MLFWCKSMSFLAERAKNYSYNFSECNFCPLSSSHPLLFKRNPFYPFWLVIVNFVTCWKIVKVIFQGIGQYNL